jgi:hypothetical protein
VPESIVCTAAKDDSGAPQCFCATPSAEEQESPGIRSVSALLP